MRAFWEIGSDQEVGEVLNGLFEYMEACGPFDDVTVEDKHRAIANRLLGVTAPKAEPKTESDFLELEFGNLELGPLRLEQAIEKTVRQRIDEIQSCISKGAPLAAVLLSGSTLEALLLNRAIQEPEKFSRANAAPKQADGKVKMLHEWTLSELINVSAEVKAIGLDVKKFSHDLRDFRNYIHPYEQSRSQFSPDIHTAKISWQVLQAVIADLSGARTS